MKYTIRIDREQAKNTYESLLVFASEHEREFIFTYQELIKAFSFNQQLQKVYFKYENGFTHFVMEIKLEKERNNE